MQLNKWWFPLRFTLSQLLAFPLPLVKDATLFSSSKDIKVFYLVPYESILVLFCEILKYLYNLDSWQNFHLWNINDVESPSNDIHQERRMRLSSSLCWKWEEDLNLIFTLIPLIYHLKHILQISFWPSHHLSGGVSLELHLTQKRKHNESY